MKKLISVRKSYKICVKEVVCTERRRYLSKILYFVSSSYIYFSLVFTDDFDLGLVWYFRVIFITPFSFFRLRLDLELVVLTYWNLIVIGLYRTLLSRRVGNSLSTLLTLCNPWVEVIIRLKMEMINCVWYDWCDMKLDLTNCFLYPAPVFVF